MPIILDGTAGIDNNATDLSYTGTLTGGTGVVNLGSGQVFKDASGNVGIGTSSPIYALDIAKNTGSLNGFQLKNTATGNVLFGGSYTDFRMQSDSADFVITQVGGGGFLYGGAGSVNIRQISNAPMTFHTNNIERARIDSSGNLLVGTTTARARVTSTNLSGFGPTINGGDWSSKAAIAVSGNFGGGISLVDGTAGYTMYCSDFGNDFYIQGATSLAGTVGGGVFLNDRGTSWSSASDERMKTIIEPITDAVAKVMELRAVIGRYNYEEEHKRHPFLIAQDVKRVLPEAVSVANKLDPVEDQRLAVSYTDTIPLLVAAIKELKAINDAQAQTIESLTARVVALEQA